jgi:hypothetical protein
MKTGNAEMQQAVEDFLAQEGITEDDRVDAQI